MRWPLRHRERDDRQIEAGLAHPLDATSCPAQPCSRASTRTCRDGLHGSGRATFRPSVTTSSSLTCWELRSPRMYWATWGRPRRGGGGSDPASGGLYHAIRHPTPGPEGPIGPCRTGDGGRLSAGASPVEAAGQGRGRPGSRVPRRARAARVVVAGEDVDDEPAASANADELVRPDEPQPVPRTHRTVAPSAPTTSKIVVSRTTAARRVVCAPPVLVTVRPVPGSSRTHSRTRRPSYRERSSASGSQHRRPRGPRREMGGERRRPRRPASGVCPSGTRS